MINFSEMSISVVISTFRRNVLLKQILLALIYQIKYLGEIIIVDNSPEQEAQRIWKNINLKKIKYIHNHNGGAPRGRNIGLKSAQSTIVAFLDDDSIPDLNWAKNIHLLFNKNISKKIIVMGKNKNYYPNSVVSCCEYYETELTYRSNFIYKNNKIYSLALDSKNFAFWREQILKDKLFFDERFSQYTSFEDIDFGIRARQRDYKIRYVPSICASHAGRSKFFNYLVREHEKKKGMILFNNKWKLSENDTKLYDSLVSSSRIFKNTNIVKSKLTEEILFNKGFFFKLFFYSILFLSKLVHLIK